MNPKKQYYADTGKSLIICVEWKGLQLTVAFDLSILSPFDLTLLMQFFSSLIFCHWTFILRPPVILFSFQYVCGIIP